MAGRIIKKSVYRSKAAIIQLMCLMLALLCHNAKAAPKTLDKSGVIAPYLATQKQAYEYNIKVYVNQNKSDKAIASYSNLYTAANKSFDNPINLILAARADYRNLLAGLYNLGYYSPSIKIYLNGQEVSAINLTDPIPHKNDIQVFIEKGNAFSFSQAIVSPKLQDSKANLQLGSELQKIGYVEGNLASAKIVTKAAVTAVDAWKNLGYAFAAVETTNNVANHKLNTLASSIIISPKQLTYYGDINLKNTSEPAYLDPDFLLWMLGLEPNSLYNPKEIEISKQRLAKLPAIKNILITPATTLDKNGKLPITVTVEEAPLHNIGIGASYTNLNGFEIETYWQHRNLFNHAENLKLILKIGKITTANIANASKGKARFDISNLSYKIGGEFNKPGVLSRDNNLIVATSAEQNVLNNYTSKALKSQIGFAYNVNQKLTGSLYLVGTHSQTYDTFYKERTFTWLGAQGKLEFDSRDNITNPLSGVYLNAALNDFYIFNRKKFINRLLVEGRTYLPLYPSKGLVLALKLTTGFILNGAMADIPPDMVFFAGGGDSVRGYPYHSIGIKTKSGDIIGGRSLITTSTELRTSLNEKWGAAIFVDAAAVSANFTPDTQQGLITSIGGGIRYSTPIGPIRFDVAVPLNRQEKDPKFGFYLGIGQAF